MNLSKLWEIVEDRRAWCATVHEGAESDPTTTESEQQYGFGTFGILIFPSSDGFVS